MLFEGESTGDRLAGKMMARWAKRRPTHGEKAIRWSIGKLTEEQK